MKIRRILGTLWLATFIAGPCYWLWEFFQKSAPAYDRTHALLSLVCLFGIIASIFMIQGANWARISIGFISLFFAVAALGEIYQQGWMRWDKWADDDLFVFSLMSIVLLFFRRSKPVS